MRKISIFLLTAALLGLTLPGFSQSMSNTDNVITLTNTCINAGVTNGAYDLELNYFSLDDYSSHTVTFSGVSVAVSGGVMTIAAPSGSFPSLNTNGWSLPDGYPGHIKLTSGSFSTYMEFYLDMDGVTIDYNCIPLPVYYNSFTGTLSGSQVVLNWQTGLEQNSTYFEIYRSSGGSGYYKIGQVPASGNSNSPVNYTFTDTHPCSSNVYYLKMLNSQGTLPIISSSVSVGCASCSCSLPAPVFCNITINGPDHICTRETPTVYSLSSAVPDFSTIVWSVDQPSAVYLRTYPDIDRAKATLLKRSTAAGVTLTATLSGCTNPITKFISAGTPTPVITAVINRCPILNATMSNAPGATTYEWWLTDENTGSSTAYPGSGISKGFQLTSSDVYDVEGTYTNACGTSSQAAAYGYQCGGSFSLANSAVVAVSPNPSSGIVSIGFTRASGKVNAAGAVKVGGSDAVQRKVYQVRVMDAQGVVRKTFSYPGGLDNVSVNLSDLTSGIYTLQIFDNKTWTSSQVVLTK